MNPNLSCPVCAGTCSLFDVVDFNKSCEEANGKFLPQAGIPIYYARCGKCGFCFAPEIAAWSPDEFEKKIYNDEYAIVDPDYVELRPRTNATNLIAMFGDQTHSIKHLDYGGGAGLLARLLKESNWQSSSYDPFVDRNTHIGQLGKFDLITAFEVFEHVPNVLELMSNLRSLLAPNGLVLFSTLLSDGQINPGQRIDWWYASPRNGHISLFSRKSLTILAQKYGFNFVSFDVGMHAFFTKIPHWAVHLEKLITVNTLSQQPDSQSITQPLQQAVTLHRSGLLQEAGERYQAILQTQPNHPEANYNLGMIAVQTNQPAAGLPYFMAALDADPARGQYWLSYIDALFQAGQLEDARQILALARQQGLEGNDVEVLAQRLEAGPRAAERPGTQAEKKPDPQEINTLLTLFSKGSLSEATSLAQSMTERFPLHEFGWKVLGALLKQMGRNADALAPMQKAVELSPGDVEAHHILGVTLYNLGRLGEAEASYRRALQINPAYADAHSNLGVTLHQSGRLDEAEVSLRRALEIQPDNAETYSNLGVTLQALDRLDEAETCYRRALQIKPDNVEAHNNLGTTLQKLGRMDESEASLRRALELKPDYAQAHCNLAVTLHDMGRLEDASVCYRRAIEIKPDLAEAHNNLGNTFLDLGRLAEAETCCRRALEIKPDYPKAHHSLSLILLTMGRLSEGWPEYEYRWETFSPKLLLRPNTDLSQWKGQIPLPGDRLLVFREQGLGDQIQFSRYLPLAANRFANCVSIVVAPPLLTLFRRSFPNVEILETAPADQSPWQWQCSLLSLPLAFDTTLDTIPNHVPYLTPDPARVSYWKSRITALTLPTSAHKIGIVWKPGSGMKNAQFRALSLQQLGPLLELPGHTWFSLQKEPDPDKEPFVISGKLVDWTDEFSDFDDTAALVVNLDLVISVDTSVVHLAGGLGRPVWLFNSHASEWRWMRDREDCSWYPTMRIFTQKTAGDWGEVVSRMAATLQQTNQSEEARQTLTAERHNTQAEKSPNPQEINTLLTLFSEGRFIEAASLAKGMTERFPLHEFGWKA
ncbi:MAG: tetratricopeptide repeat protein, partial [Gammaproteobacteria bacterium]|nr:tetratricopeptide repeat protein [Gammaproteobacteria bacterium]